MTPPSAPGRSGAPIRVAFCLDTLETGGTELNAIRTAERFDRARVEVELFCFQNRGTLRARAAAAFSRVRELPVRGVLNAATARTGFAFARTLRRERFDVVHAHEIYSNMMLVPWARWAGVPLVIASRRWWTETNHPMHARANRWSYRLAHRVLANSESVGRLVEREEGVDAGRVVVVPNFVDQDAFVPPSPDAVSALRASLCVDEGDEAVGIVANLHAIKDHASLLRAAALLAPERPRLKLVLVGDGAERGQLQALTDSLGIGARVVFAGQRPHAPSPHWIFRVSVLCSRGEGFPNSVVEAMAARRPLVATAVGGVPDVVQDGVTGLLVPPGDPRALADAIGALLLDPARAAALGAAGAERARDRYRADVVVPRLQTLYAELLRRA